MLRNALFAKHQEPAVLEAVDASSTGYGRFEQFAVFGHLNGVECSANPRTNDSSKGLELHVSINSYCPKALCK